jgi:phospholipase C
MVRANTPYRDTQLAQAPAPSGSPIPHRIGEPSPIRYVLYIIKENRTYDQVYGDLPQGNGDPNLCLFGRQVTPNQHALAEQYVLLDNIYCAGEVSQDGHPWSTQALVSDYTQRAWPAAYSGKGSIAPEDNLKDTKAGFIWEACARAGLTYRSYGEYADHKSLIGHHSEAYIGKVKYGSYSAARDTGRADIFCAEFKEYERTKTIPRFMVMSLGENHTHGTAPGQHTPKACVASNDVAVGRIVETISRSSVWNQYAIFIIEDDAQNGPDHVDAHRTAALVISPYTRRHAVDSTFYSTNSMLRTMELILGIGPLSQYDAAATPMVASFTNRADLTPFTALPAQIDLEAKNKRTEYGAAASARMDFSEYDRIDEDTLNRVLWHSIKGRNVPYPKPKHRGVRG